MLTREQIISQLEAGRSSSCIDSRDYGRLADFFPIEQWKLLGFKAPDKGTRPKVRPWTRELVLEQLRDDVAFGFEKALNRRGISAALMHSVVLMWMWVLEDDAIVAFAADNNYAQYGLPLFKEVAVKYGFTDQIPSYDGSEERFADWGE